MLYLNNNIDQDFWIFISQIFHLPPITHKVLLVKDGSVRAKESVGLATGAAHVERLKNDF